jgi:UDP-3-O-[3-hydroxymyristoyl] glucosamine N-acyltransferase
MNGKESVVYEYDDGRIQKAVRFKNPDGSEGGWVPPNFEAEDVVIGKEVVIFPGVSISRGARITGACFIVPD